MSGLFEDEPRAYARRDDPFTSHEAAAAVPVTMLQDMVLKALLGHPVTGLCTHEVEDITGLAAGSVTPRMKPLEDLGLVVRRRDADGTVVTRIPRGHKRRQTVWVLTRRGWEHED
jgi:DNA-binding MarR family transcriptional regulator